MTNIQNNAIQNTSVRIVNFLLPRRFFANVFCDETHWVHLAQFRKFLLNFIRVLICRRYLFNFKASQNFQSSVPSADGSFDLTLKQFQIEQFNIFASFGQTPRCAWSPSYSSNTGAPLLCPTSIALWHKG